MRLMKRSAASTTPTVTDDHHVEEHGQAEAGEQHRDVAARRDPQHVQRSAAARSCSSHDEEQRGERRPWAGSRAAARAAARPGARTRAWTTAATGERAPARMLVAVRAIAPVAAMPPKKGATRLPTPWPEQLGVGIVSLAASCRRRPPRRAATRWRRAWRSRRRREAGRAASSKDRPSGWPSGPGMCQGRATAAERDRGDVARRSGCRWWPTAKPGRSSSRGTRPPRPPTQGGAGAAGPAGSRAARARGRPG